MPAPNDLLSDLRAALQAFATRPPADAARDLLARLGYASSRTVALAGV